MMKDSKYKVYRIDKRQHWIYISCDDMDCESPENLYQLIEWIALTEQTTILNVGSFRYRVMGSLDIVYQWDSCFGIVITYKKSNQLVEICAFLEKYMDVSLD